MDNPILKMRVLWMAHQVAFDMKRDIDHEIDQWDEDHGFGYDIPFDRDRYEVGHKCDEFQDIWTRYLEARNLWLDTLDQFCDEVERATSGRITSEMARELATNPRYRDRLNGIMCEC